MAEFKLRIRTGNDAMLTNGDIADALTEISEELRKYGNKKATGTEKHSIKDVTGKTVGYWLIY